MTLITSYPYNLCLINNVEYTPVFLVLKVFTFNNLYMFSAVEISK